MKSKLNILLWARRKSGQEKSNPAHEVHIMCRLTVGGQQAHLLNFHTGFETQKSNWHAAGAYGHVIGRTPADKHVNTHLTKLVDELNDIHADLERQGKPVTAGAIYRLYKNSGAPVSLLELYDAWLAERKTLVGQDIKETSYKVSLWRRLVLTNFLEAKKLLDLRPEEFKHSMADRFIHWGLTEKDYNRNNINKALQNVVQALRWGVRRELLDKNPVDAYQYKAAPRAEIKFLNVGELQQLAAQAMPNSQLEKARDCFVFQCWTGLAYTDLAGLNVARDTEYHRDKGTSSLRRVLRVTRAKSTLQKGYECVIPLLPEAERILALYSDKLPVPSNQYYNRQLKQVGEVCGFAADQMTTHVGRKTAGVMMLNLGIRMETVSKFLGHSSVKMTEKLYAKILDTTVVDDFSKLFGAAPSIAPPPPTVYELSAPVPIPAPVLVALRPARRIATKGGQTV